jgi:Predicted esterase of the alpha-beta hydrolase superfamily
MPQTSGNRKRIRGVERNGVTHVGALLTVRGTRERESFEPRHKTALVLSAGGMFGAYQAGVWKELADWFQPDIVVGASIGSLNGWLIAGGCPAEELVRRWLTLEGASRHRWRLPAFLSDGIIDCTSLNQWIQEMYEEFKPRVEYGLVATETFTLRPKLFRSHEITWKHLASSCAVPVFLGHHRIDGTIYSDGGIIDPLPLWAAVEMGATRMVTVNLLKQRPMLLRALAKAARAYSGFREEMYDRLEVVDISPSAPLGPARDSIHWNSENAARWVDLGKKDACVSKHLVVECFERK